MFALSRYCLAGAGLKLFNPHQRQDDVVIDIKLLPMPSGPGFASKG
jgi:hypothetical protein